MDKDLAKLRDRLLQEDTEEHLEMAVEIFEAIDLGDDLTEEECKLILQVIEGKLDDEGVAAFWDLHGKYCGEEE